MPNVQTQSESYTQGLINAFICYFIWGLFPIYWHLLAEVPSVVILANRVLWSAVFLLIASLVINKKLFLETFNNKRNVLYMTISGFIVSFNWGVYIYAVNHNFVIESSLGYYINPLINVLLGVLFFKEKLNNLEKTATILASIGVAYFTIQYGSFPYIAFALAISMGLYGMIKKKINLPAIQALTIETLMVAPLAILYLLYVLSNKSLVVSDLSTFNIFLLIMGGIVTAIPLLFFAKAVQILPYSTLGFIQYIGPTLQLLIGVYVFHEKFTATHAVCFIFIWLALVFFTINIVRNSRLSIRRTNR